LGNSPKGNGKKKRCRKGHRLGGDRKPSRGGEGVGLNTPEERKERNPMDQLINLT